MMSLRDTVGFVSVLVLVTACASNPSVSSLSSLEREKVASLVVVPAGAIPRESYKVLGSVEGLACKRNLYSSGAPSIEEAQQGVRIRAAQLGADAVTNLLCEKNHKVDWGRNCWQSVVCVADAISVADRSLLSKGGPSSQPPSGSVSTGTAWVATPGLIVTNNHIVQGAREVTGRLRSGKHVSLRLVASDPVNDVALLAPDPFVSLPAPLSVARREAALGETVFTVGYPHADILGANAKVTSGIVSARSGIRDDPRLYQTTVALQAGNSGGPLLNMNGEAVGITTSKLDAVRVFRITGDLPEGVNFAVKSYYIGALIETTATSERPTPPPARSTPFQNLQDAVKEVQDAILFIEAR